MPANLSAPYLDAEQRYKSAKTAEEKMLALREMMSTIPKHKGTEKLQADIKTRIAKLQESIEKASKKSGRKDQYTVPREGAGQMTVVGPTNAGKSELLAAVTNAQPEIGDWPFTTQLPLSGMMNVFDIQIQLVDLPAIDPERTENWTANIIRYSDVALVVLDGSRDDVLEQLAMVEIRLEQSRVLLVPDGSGSGHDEVPAKKAAGVLINKVDEPAAETRILAEADAIRKRFKVLPISAYTGLGIEKVGAFCFDLLGIIRIYSKQPGKEPDMSQPFILQRGATVLDVARQVHKDFVAQLKFARVWGSTKFPGQKVNRDAVVCDGDIVELNL